MSRDSSFLVRSWPAVRTMKPRPLGGFSSSRFSRSRRRSASSSILRDTPNAAQGGHQHQVAAGDADVGRECRALGADAFLDHLHQHFVAAAEDILNGRFDAQAGRRFGSCAAAAGAAITAAAFASSSSPWRPPCAVGSCSGSIASLAEVLGFHVADVEKAVAADAEVDERGLDARLDVDDAPLVDIARPGCPGWLARCRVPPACRLP